MMHRIPYGGPNFIQKSKASCKIVPPNITDHSYGSQLADIDYLHESMPLFLLMVILEFLVRSYQGKRPRFHDRITSLSAGVLNQMAVPILRSIEYVAYIWVHQRFCLINLNWESWMTWLIGFIGVDFCFYWIHRASHEVNLLWAAHQVHHSSESYDLSVGVRHSILQKYFSWMFYLPLAVFMPTPIFLIHMQFNFIYQTWIHSNLIYRLGPLEYILNTPSHHRVHHGRNPSCIDKNYGGVLIIFDRLFGTFQDENDIEEEIAYGKVYLLQTCDPIEIQMVTYKSLYRDLSNKSLSHILQTIFKGPSWSPGKPRLGNPSERIEVTGDIPFYRPKTSSRVEIYITLHYILIFGLYYCYPHIGTKLTTQLHVMCWLYMITSLYSLGNLLDAETFHYGLKLEIARCVGTIPLLTVADYYYYEGFPSAPNFQIFSHLLKLLFTVFSIIAAGGFLSLQSGLRDYKRK